MNSKLKSPKNVDLSLNSGRLNLLKQRLVGNDIISDGNNSNQARDSSSSFGVSDNTNTDTSSLPSRSNSVTIHIDNPKKTTEEDQYKIELKRQLREKNDKQFEEMMQFTINCLFEFNMDKQKIKAIELSEKYEKLGHIITSISGAEKWCGGTDAEILERDIEILTQEIDSFKKKDQHKKFDTSSSRKSCLQALLKEKKASQKQLEVERSIFKNLLLNNYYQLQSEYKVNQALDKERYILTEFSGRGGCSEVWKAFDKKEIRYVAIKIQKMDPKWSDATKHNFIKHMGREITIMESTQHQNVIEYYERFYIAEDIIAIVMEYCDGGDLSTMLKKRGKIPEKEAKLILAQTMSGLIALRSKHMYVIHYDLKPGNILFNDEGVVKITDFGLSKIIEGNAPSIELTSQGTGTYFYAAPETFQRGANVSITKSVDTWSLGIIFFEMIYGVRPFDGGQSQITFSEQIDTLVGEVQFPQAPKLSQEGQNFIKTCLIKNPLDRPELPILMQDSYIKQIIEDMNS